MAQLVTADVLSQVAPSRLLSVLGLGDPNNTKVSVDDSNDSPVLPVNSFSSHGGRVTARKKKSFEDRDQVGDLDDDNHLDDDDDDE